MTEGHCKPNMNFDNSSIVTASGDSDPQMPATGSEQAGSQGSSSNDRRGMGVASQAPITSHATSAETTRSVVKVTRETAEGVSGTPTEKTVQRGLVANQGTVANQATMLGLGKLEEAITGAPNTKKDVKDSAKTLGSNLRLMHRYLTALFKGSATRDRVPPAQQQLQIQQQQQMQQQMQQLQLQMLSQQQQQQKVVEQQEQMLQQVKAMQLRQQQPQPQPQQQQLQPLQQHEPSRKQQSHQRQRMPHVQDPQDPTQAGEVTDWEEVTGRRKKIRREKRVSSRPDAIIVKTDNMSYADMLKIFKSSDEM
ncbi:hypothetical protein QTP88_029216 [Uroleucon formosanum]